MPEPSDPAAAAAAASDAASSFGNNDHAILASAAAVDQATRARDIVHTPQRQEMYKQYGSSEVAWHRWHGRHTS